jgi:hypothetical protein
MDGPYTVHATVNIGKENENSAAQYLYTMQNSFAYAIKFKPRFFTYCTSLGKSVRLQVSSCPELQSLKSVSLEIKEPSQPHDRRVVELNPCDAHQAEPPVLPVVCAPPVKIRERDILIKYKNKA